MTNIYIIDDDRDFSAAVKSVLEKEGHTISVANDPENGLTMIEQATPDLLLLDIMMQHPDDGIVVARKLRKAGYKFPIVMLSAIGKVTGMDYDTDAELLPASAFLEKPVMPATLIAKVNQLLAVTQ